MARRKVDLAVSPYRDVDRRAATVLELLRRSVSSQNFGVAAINPDGSINSDYMSTLMDNVKTQMMESLEAKGVDLSRMGDLNLDLGPSVCTSPPTARPDPVEATEPLQVWLRCNHTS